MGEAVTIIVEGILVLERAENWRKVADTAGVEGGGEATADAGSLGPADETE